MLQIISFLALIGLILSGIIAGVSCIQYKSFDKSLKILTVYFVLAFFAELTSYFLAKNSINNLFIFHIFSLIEYGLLFLFFKELFFDFRKKKLIDLLIILGLLFLILNSLYIQGLNKFNSYGLAFVSSSIMALSILFYKTLLDKGELGLSFEKHKWIVFGIFMSHAVSIVVLLFSNAISGFDKSNQLIVWILRAILSGMAKLIICYALLKDFSKIRKTNLD